MLQIIISIIFYFTFILYAFMGVYCLTLNKKALLNQIFFLLCLSFSIWAFAFAMSNSLSSYDDVLIWRRVASLGWGVAFSFILHFILILTNEQKILNVKIIYGVLYLPAVITIFVFGINKDMADDQYNLVSTAAGWGNIPVNNFWDMFYNLYYFSFSLFTLFLLLKWYCHTKEPSKKNQALLLFSAFMVSLVMGTLSEMLANSYLSFKIPSIAPIIILIPVITFAYNIKKYGLMAKAVSYKIHDVSDILSEYNHAAFMRTIAVVYLIISIFILGECFLYSNAMMTYMMLSTLYVIMGLVILLLPFSDCSTMTQDRIMTGIMVLTIPLASLRFAFDYSSNVLWTIPLIFLMMTIIFNRKNMFKIIAVVSTFTGIYTWLTVPEPLLYVGTYDYIARLVIYIIAIVLAAYINRIYIARLKENDQQVGFQKMITRVTTNFVAVTANNFDDKVADLLKRSGCYTNADRTYVGIFSEELQTVDYPYQWLGIGMEPVIGRTDQFPLAALDFSISQLLANQIVYIPDVKKLPLEATNERKRLLSQYIRSQILVPIRSKDCVIGLIGFDQISEDKTWRMDDLELLKVLANVLADAIAKVAAENKMNVLAYYDVLTKLPNRVLFGNRLEQAIDLAKRSNDSLGVIFIDIDGFNEINDALGHDRGDQLLNEIGKRFSALIQKDEIVARLSGDEFVIMVPQVAEIQDLEAVAKMIMSVFLQPVTIGDQEVYVNGSAGVAVYPDDGETVEALINNADLAMYAAKKNGKGHYVFCSVEMKNDLQEKIVLTNSLYQALERNELLLHYQPQVSIKDNTVIGFEALLRWKHSEFGLISPSVFIPLAEKSGLINGIGAWVLQTACAQNKDWQDRGGQPIKMAVNLSVEQFRSGNLESIVKACLKRNGLQPRYLELEITEGIVMQDSQQVLKSLHALKNMGVGISIADFGVEFSSLSRLKDLPVDRIKIDMQFIQGIGVNPKDESIIVVMIHLAKKLGLKVIAEGVETAVQYEFLRAEDCDEIQGYYNYMPLTTDEIDDRIY